MNHFNRKSLVFYGVAISSVITLFSIVAAYGEANLKAPTPVGGRYRITQSNQPNCLMPDRTLLTIQQSGVYINGFLSAAETNDKSAQSHEKKPDLTGRWDDRTLALSGQMNLATLGQNDGDRAAAACPDKLQSIRVQATVTGKNLSGSLKSDSDAREISFSAQQEPATASDTPKH